MVAARRTPNADAVPFSTEPLDPAALAAGGDRRAVRGEDAESPRRRSEEAGLPEAQSERRSPDAGGRRSRPVGVGGHLPVPGRQVPGQAARAAGGNARARQVLPVDPL